MLLRPLLETQYRLSKFTTNHYTLFQHFHTATPTFSPNNPPTTAKMPSYIVTLKDTATDEEIAKTKEDVKAQGGKIGHEYTLIKAFQAIYPEGAVFTLENHEHVKGVEADQEVRTQ
ncbi:hypothetical protein GE21DRAFT_6178 [Neurospora crassa]|uniref:Inhibitor I9 domain-containing protein n=1 Tax=Neurospora crassa (strain ATCC 24698 / 74-OR23-1A / CBS 708.71 / DSM 1257 / FGSC 987) TaxID=367110 RepID=V5INN0_NEUCR|nr:hypothetical protein NCU16822 [Neurospora crassa OR74A]ESA42970.1 hypothetical protein NCU16822 [Neurospora crassa OR74A]KHE82306.1 hypothetical protein GE21DRAFT_6178 [Neurospora crassa]|eukprot:XP_011394409.1 hypothetical protein NCU16822 [Neurospora crassa OR74A]